VKIVSNGSNLEITGDVKVKGKIEATDDVTAGTVSLQNHAHGPGSFTNSGGNVLGLSGSPS
jgi:phage baseplate assembly protein gpV